MNKDCGQGGSRSRSCPAGVCGGEHMVIGAGQGPCVWETDVAPAWEGARTGRRRKDKGRQEVPGLKQA